MSNPFKSAINSGQQQVGLWLSLADPYATELCATAGFEWLLIDGEHAPNDVRSILHALQAAAPYGSHPVVRVVQGEAALIKQVLDIGAKTVLVPMVDTAEQAAAMARAMRYPPLGIRGVGAGVARVSQWGARSNYLNEANDEVCLLVQAETTTAIANLEAICAVDGVDGVFIGPADLAASMGHRGNPGHPDVQAAIDDAIRRITAAGKAAGTLTSDIAAGRHFLDIGARFVAVGIDTTLLAQATRKLAREFGLGSAPAASKNSGPY
jgi:4-hydroxy-2-oxoheptanedioate aldolase